ncbi:hypothetical protein BGZ94_007436 [Podila epigama]|nr:hypothetical protein BGZ94_007436 [Podila epigama]
MSPVGRNRHYKGLHLPHRMTTMAWDFQPSCVTNIISANNHKRVDIGGEGWGMTGALFEPSTPHDVDGTSYVYNKGPAGQTPFPTLIAMNGYFPSTIATTTITATSHQQPTMMPTQSQAQMPPFHPQQGFQPYPATTASSPSSHRASSMNGLKMHRKRPSLNNIKSEQNDFWHRAYPRPTTELQPLTKEQLKMWHYHRNQVQTFL